MNRRAFLVAALGLALVACKDKKEERCKTCGMKIDPGSSWRTELVGTSGRLLYTFPSPRDRG